jgi:hypothetical protein
VAAAFSAFHPQAATVVSDWQAPKLELWLDVLRGNTSVVDLAARAKRSRYATSRWLRGQAQPRVPDFLRLIDAATGRASDWVAALVPIANVPVMAHEHRMRNAAKGLALEQPWTEAILRLMETRDYSAVVGSAVPWLAQRLNVPEPTVAVAVDAMSKAGVLVRRKGRLLPGAELTVDTRAQPEAFNRLRMHWSQAAAQRLMQPKPEDWFGYNVCTLSVTELEQVREILRGAYRQIRSLAAASIEPERALLINMQLLTWD